MPQRLRWRTMELGAVLVGEGVVCVAITTGGECRMVLSRKWIKGVMVVK